MDNKPIIIDEVDVSECKHFKNRTCLADYLLTDMAFSEAKCKLCKDCYFKQLARKTQECEELTKNYIMVIRQRNKAEQQLKRIRDIAEQQVPYINLDQVKTCAEVEYDYADIVWNLEQRMYNILQIIDEVE